MHTLSHTQAHTADFANSALQCRVVLCELHFTAARNQNIATLLMAILNGNRLEWAHCRII